MTVTFDGWDVDRSPTLAEVYAALPPMMSERPYGETEEGQPLDLITGNTFFRRINATLDIVAEQATSDFPPNLTDDEIDVRVREVRASAIEQLVRRLNDAIIEPEYSLTAENLLDQSRRYSVECSQYLAKFCFELAGERPDFYVDIGDRTLPHRQSSLTRPMSLRQAYMMLSRNARWISPEAIYSELTGPTSVTIRTSNRVGVSVSTEAVGRAYVREVCHAYSSMLASLPREHSQQPRAGFRELGCQLHGDDFCTWEFTWLPEPEERPPRWVWLGAALTLALVIFALTGVSGSSIAAWFAAVPLLVALLVAQRRQYEAKNAEREVLLAEQRDLAEMEVGLSTRAHDRLKDANDDLQAANRDLGKQNLRIEALHSVGVSISATREIEPLLDQSVGALVNSLDFDRAVVILLARDSNEIDSAQMRSINGAHEDLTERRGPIARELLSVADQVADSTDPVLLTADQVDLPVWIDDATELLGVSLVSRGRRLGAVFVDNGLSARPFDAEQPSLLQTVASQIAVAVDGAQTYRTLEDRVEIRTAQWAEATAAAEAASEAKSTFLANVSHELRTPLTSILGFVRLAQKQLDDRVFPAVDASNERAQKAVTRTRENLEIVHLEGKRLTSMINDVLDLEKIEAGKMEWAEAIVHMDEVIAQAVAATSSIADHGGISVIVDSAADLPTVTGDHDRLVQVMINLLANALKFTPKGSVVINAVASNLNVTVRVIDHGPGIAEEDLQSVFEKFRQVGDTLTEKPTGTGLGLPICREIIEYHDGAIWAESVPGTGSTFCFTLPARVSE